MAYRDISDDENIISLRNRMNDLCFKNLEGFKVGTILSVPLFSIERETISNWNLLKYIMKVCLFWSYHLSDDLQKIRYFKSIDYINALGHQQLYNRMITSIGQGVEVTPIKYIHFDNKLPKYISLYCSWKKTITSLYSDNKISHFLTLHLLKAYIELEKLKSIVDNWNDSIIVTFCDVHPVDAIVTQYVNRNGGTTVTLQHGHFNAKDRGWVFNQSLSDYFLLHGECAKMEALESEHKKDGLIPVGMMNFIGINRKKADFDVNNKCFALILNGPGAMEDNEEFIRCANKFAKAHNMTYILRGHPAIALETYESIINDDYLERISNKQETIENLLQKVQFVMVGNSTVFIESLYLGKLTLRYVGKSQDIYEKIKWCVFHNMDELNKLYERSIADVDGLKRKINDTTKWLCSDGNIGENYRKVFEDIRRKRKDENSWNNTGKI